MSLTNLYATCTTAGNALLRGIDYVGNSPFTSLATGILTSWWFGSHRARCLQDWRIDRGETATTTHTRKECEIQKCAEALNPLRHDSFREPCYKTDCSAGTRGQRTVGHWTHEGTNYHKARHQKNRRVWHSPLQCEQNKCTTEPVAWSKPCKPCEKAHHQTPDGTFYHAVEHQQLLPRKLPLWKALTPCCRTQRQMVAVYGGILFVSVWGGGRLPFTGRSVTYVITHTIAKFFDGVVVATCFIGPIQVSNAATRWLDFSPRAEKLDLLPSTEKWKRRSLPAITLGLVYFAARIADGWLAVSMPMNTAPLVSLLKKLDGWHLLQKLRTLHEKLNTVYEQSLPVMGDAWDYL
jgi:hypothetical protein